jgi:hypothetical protein
MRLELTISLLTLLAISASAQTYVDAHGSPVARPKSLIVGNLRGIPPSDEHLARAGIYRAVIDQPEKGMVAVGPAVFDRIENGRAIMIAPTAPAAEVEARRDADEQAAREADPITILTRRIEAIEARIASLEAKPIIIDPTPTPTPKETRP